MKTFRTSHALAVWAAVLAALALLSACDSNAVAPDQTEGGTMPNESPIATIKTHKWQMCSEKVRYEQTCYWCNNASDKWEVWYMTSDKPNDTIHLEAVDTLTYCKPMGTFADTTRIVFADKWGRGSAWFLIDDTIVKPFVWKTRMNPDQERSWNEIAKANNKARELALKEAEANFRERLQQAVAEFHGYDECVGRR